MGVVHLARRGDGAAGRAQGAAPPHRRRRRGAAAAGPRGQLALAASAAGGSPRSSTPTRGARSPTSPPATCPASRCTSYVARGGSARAATTCAGSPSAWPRALASVHAVGVLHRDVKPSNVLMEGRTPILIDFGLARVADDPRLTHTGWLLGTPGYLAPEILYGDDATAASDVHSWAATVAFAGTGQPPFGRGPSMAIMDRVRRGEHDLTGLPDDLRRVVDAGARPRPAPPADPRPGSATALVGGPMPVVATPAPRGAAATTPTPSRWRWPPPADERTISFFDDDDGRGPARLHPAPRRGPARAPRARVAERLRRGLLLAGARARPRRPP